MKNLNNNKLEQGIFETLLGCLLGDAHIGTRGGKVYMTFEQSLKHREYIMSLHDLLKGIVGLEVSDIKYYKREDSRYNSTNESIYFKVYGSELLAPLAAIFLSDIGKKVLAPSFENHLSPIALAY